MQRKLRHAAWVLVANASLLVMACATAIDARRGRPDREGSSPIGGDGGATGGSGGAVASAGAGRNTNGGKAGPSRVAPLTVGRGERAARAASLVPAERAEPAAAETAGPAAAERAGPAAAGTGGKGGTGGGGKRQRNRRRRKRRRR